MRGLPRARSLCRGRRTAGLRWLRKRRRSRPIQLSRSVDQALRVTGVRAVIATGWGGLAGTAWNADTIVVEQASHQWLFPRVAAVVHHGGAGTTAAGLQAGCPSIVCPFQGDQHLGERRCGRLALAPSQCRRRTDRGAARCRNPHRARRPRHRQTGERDLGAPSSRGWNRASIGGNRGVASRLAHGRPREAPPAAKSRSATFHGGGF